tara:strand:+ start:156 stop:797 length:642 start_codon:yes stop_codon:yes gene_type:complete
MAAGRGRRMRPLTDKIPKAMAPLKGSTLIATRIKKISNYFNNIHITVGYKGPILANHVIGLKVNSVFNTNNKGNSWWLYNTLMSKINEPILVLTCDNIFRINFKKIYDEYIKLKSPACLLIPVKPIVNLRGDYIHYSSNNIINKISKTKKTDLYCSGIQILNPFKINNITNPTSNFISVWDQLIKKKQLKKSNFILKKWYAVDDLLQLKTVNI